VHHDHPSAARARSRGRARDPRLVRAGLPVAGRPPARGERAAAADAAQAARRGDGRGPLGRSPVDRRRGGAMTTDAELARQVRALTDRAEILDCLSRYARGMDRFDRALARSAYHDDAVDDHIGFVGPVDDFLDWAYGYHGGQVRHQHYLTNHSIEIDGDDAHVETYYLFLGTERDEDAP